MKLCGVREEFGAARVVRRTSLRVRSRSVSGAECASKLAADWTYGLQKVGVRLKAVKMKTAAR